MIFLFDHDWECHDHRGPYFKNHTFSESVCHSCLRALYRDNEDGGIFQVSLERGIQLFSCVVSVCKDGFHSMTMAFCVCCVLCVSGVSSSVCLICQHSVTLTDNQNPPRNTSTQQTRGIDPMFDQRRRQWANIGQPLGQCLVLAGYQALLYKDSCIYMQSKSLVN